MQDSDRTVVSVKTFRVLRRLAWWLPIIGLPAGFISYAPVLVTISALVAVVFLQFVLRLDFMMNLKQQALVVLIVQIGGLIIATAISVMLCAVDAACVEPLALLVAQGAWFLYVLIGDIVTFGAVLVRSVIRKE